ncbi:hypothetical protein LJB76_02465 [Clostridia bacterium OttesenSCG-928-O13]|nr:hypothetical protein [Clostridia bacterium OttesenSCG-928-O13]
MPGWFDLSKLNLPEKQLKLYAELQEIGQHYQETYAYQKKHNRASLENLKAYCAQMDFDLIMNYGALEKEG